MCALIGVYEKFKLEVYVDGTKFHFSKERFCVSFEESNVFGNGKCELSAIQDGRNFWQGKVQNFLPILSCTFLARKSAKLIANFSAT